VKVIVDLEKKSLRMLENERSIFRGEYGADKLELYINKTLENEFPTITALLSNGRKIGPYSSDEGFKQQVVDGVQYTVASFTLSKQNGFTLSEGKMMITIWMNSNGKKEAIGNVTLNVINTTAFDDGDIIISGDVEGTLVNYRVELENLQGQVNTFNGRLNNVEKNKADTSYVDLIKNKLSQYLPLSGGNVDWLNVDDTLNVDGTAYLHSGISLNGGAIFLDGNRNDTRITVNGEEIAFLNEIVDGFIVAKKAEQDSDGNRIVDTYIKVNQKGVANGVATLDGNCKIPSSQLPSYVDDVMEYTTIDEFPATGESGKIYLETSTNKTYRWSGSKYGEISSSIALGETSSTAYAGDKGKANAEAIKDLQDNKVGKDEAFLKVDGQEVVTSFEIATSDEIDTESENQVPTSKAVQSMIENSLGNIESLLEVI
jgi:hypothetical protein